MTPNPFTVHVPQEKIDAIRRRLELAEVGYAPDDDQGQYGTNAAYLAELRDYWLNHYDWRRTEVALNRFPQFKARIGQTELHFYHVRGQGRNCLPLLLSHGWPGSVYEFLEVIEPLRAASFDLVIPSIPGYGFSPRPARPIGLRRVARLWRAPSPRITAMWSWPSISTSSSPSVPAAMMPSWLSGGVPSPQPWPRKAPTCACSRRNRRPSAWGTGQQSPGLRRLGTGKFNAWTDTTGHIGSRFSKNELLTQIMIPLVNDAVISAFWLYYGSGREEPTKDRIDLPTGFAAFPGEIIPPPPRRVAELDFNITRWSVMDRGGHFAAFR